MNKEDIILIITTIIAALLTAAVAYLLSTDHPLAGTTLLTATAALIMYCIFVP